MDFGKINITGVHRQEMRDLNPPEHFVAHIVIMNRQHSASHSPLYHLKCEATGSGLESLKRDLSHAFYLGHFAFLGEVETVDRSKKIIYLANGNTVAYKHLIVASGIKHDMGAEEFSAAIKSLVDALKVPTAFSKDLLDDMIYRSKQPSSLAAKHLPSQDKDNILQERIAQESEQKSSPLSNTRLFDIHL